MSLAAAAGCAQVEHGVFATDEALRLMASSGTYFSPQCELIFPQLPRTQGAIRR
jgi:imidazolonepropionase-like amidohydrolase